MAASNPPISKLSVDHFSLIAKYLSNNDIQSARLSSRDLHFFLSPYLFRSITFASHQEHLDRIDAVSKHSIFSSHIQILRFDTTIFKRPNDLEWSDEWECFQGWGLEMPSLIIRNGHQRNGDPSVRCLDINECCHYICQHEGINQDLKMHLSRTLDQLPKINTVILSKNLKLSSISLDSRAALHQYSISRIWIRKSQWLALLRAIIGQNLRISKLLSEGYWVEKKYALLDNRDFGDDSDVIGSIKYCIPNFESAVYAKEIPPAILASDFELNTDELALTQRVFNNLTHLDLHFFTKDKVGDFDPYLTGCFPTSYWADFPKVLRSLTQITNLSLDFRIERMIDQQCEVYYHHDDLAELFENPPLTLPKLHTLSLSQFRSSGATVKSFLERHNDIQNLKLKYIIELTDLATYWDNPYDPNNRLHLQWIEVLNIMKGHGLMRLDLRGIEGFGIGCNRYGNENENLLLASIHNYVLHGYGHNPLLQWKNNMEGQGTSPDWDEELW